MDNLPGGATIDDDARARGGEEERNSVGSIDWVVSQRGVLGPPEFDPQVALWCLTL